MRNRTLEIPVSDRLDRLLHTMRFRNARATFKHFDADALPEFGATLPTGDPYDWTMRRFMESGVPWRDTFARRPSSQPFNLKGGDRHDTALSSAA